MYCRRFTFRNFEFIFRAYFNSAARAVYTYNAGYTPIEATVYI